MATIRIVGIHGGRLGGSASREVILGDQYIGTLPGDPLLSCLAWKIPKYCTHRLSILVSATAAAFQVLEFPELPEHLEAFELGECPR